MSNQLLNKYAEIISSLKASNGIKVVSAEEINDNEVFLRLKDSFESYFETWNQQLSFLKKDPKGSFLVYDQLEFSRKKYAKTGGKRLKKPKIEALFKIINS